jgi:tetratricopeptide (TPR) repeat protein
VPYEYGYNGNNYYTYNYYGTDTGGPATEQQTSEMQQYTSQKPAPATSADQYFDDGVKAFGEGDYSTALAKFALARETAPDDKILPFAHSQAYFALEDYKSAATVLRAAIAKVKPETEGIYYPRGLYPSDDVLLKQIEQLREKADRSKGDADLQLLLGYQYLGLDELDKAEGPLKNAIADELNGDTAKSLLQMLDNLRTGQTTTPKEQAPATPKEQAPATPKEEAPQGN